ncbi:hypothetical protein DAI43_33635 [Achromobacter xylosoxidans]|nr:hypothetical protein DAI43_33635 [Achromobacter xylosoxidans]
MTSTEYVLSETPFIVRRRVKWGDCDPAGVVYTVTFGEYVLSAAELFYGHLFNGTPQRIKDEHGFGTPTRALSFDFQASLWPDEEFDMCVRVEEIRTRTYTLHVAGTPQAETRLSDTLRAWRLESCADMPALRLSQGQGRRLALAAVVLGAKPLWLLDEPDAGLDTASLEQLRLALEAHLAAGGAAVLASHREPGTAAAHTQTLDMDDYADAGYAVAVGIA